MDKLIQEYENLKERINLEENKEKREEIWRSNFKENSDFNLIKFEMDTKIQKLLKEIQKEDDDEYVRLLKNDCEASIIKVRKLLDKYGWK